MADSGGWSTIESDAGVFTHLIETLGVKDVQFEELLSLSVDSLLPLYPIYGLIFLFKYPTAPASSTATADGNPSSTNQPPDGTFAPAAAETLFFAHQRIQNACGTQALLSILLNKDSSTTAPTTTTSTINIGPTLSSFKQFTSAFPPDLRGDCLSNSAEIRTAHNAFAKSNPFIDESTHDPRDEPEDAYHFIAYVPVDGTLYELDGLQPWPISHGALPRGSDAADSDAGFAEAIVPVLRRRVDRYDQREIRFNLLACVRDQRAVARERGDAEGLAQEEARHREWAWEGELRRANLVGLVGEVVREVGKGVWRDGGGEDGWQKWVAESEGRTVKRLVAARRLRDDMAMKREMDGG